jgi:lipopolysaccharide export system protein LptA
MKMRNLRNLKLPKFLFFSFSFFLFFFFSFSKIAFAERRPVQIIYADFARSLKTGEGTINRLIGNVKLFHNNTTMTCDSAYIYPDNRFEAFSRVVMNKDTIWLFGDYLDYQSATDIGKVRGRMVTLIDGDTRLRTQFLDFNTATNVAFFTKGGTIDNADNLLESEQGYYYSDEKLAIFNTQVEMKNDEYKIKSDSLHYLTNLDIATFFKQTYVFHQDVFASFRHGYYNKNDDHFFMADNVYMMSDKQESWSDSAHYYKLLKEGEKFDNVQLYDSAQFAMTLGDYAKVYEEQEFAFITKQPVGVFFSEKAADDTMFLKADTLLVCRIITTDTLLVKRDSMFADTLLARQDSLPTTDTLIVKYDTAKYMQGFRNVKFYHPEVQGACDSMSYSVVDSLLEMFDDPVIWNEENQLTGDKINMLLKNNQLYSIELDGAGFIASQDDSVKSYYNQVSGKVVVAYFEQNDLYRVDVFGNGQSVYFLRDEMKLSGVNNSASNDMVIYVKNRKVKRITYLSEPTSDILPPKDIDLKALTLRGFTWQESIRPQSRNEITTRTIRPSQREESRQIQIPTFAITRRIDSVKNGFFPPANLRSNTKQK